MVVVCAKRVRGVGRIQPQSGEVRSSPSGNSLSHQKIDLFRLPQSHETHTACEPPAAAPSDPNVSMNRIALFIDRRLGPSGNLAV